MDLDLFLNAALLILAFLDGVVAVGGKTWIEGDASRKGGITGRGWLAVLLLAITLGLGIFKEVQSNEKEEKLREAEAKYQEQFLASQRELKELLGFTTGSLNAIANADEDIQEKERLAGLALDNLFNLNRPAILKVTAKVGEEAREKSGFFVTRDGYIVTADFAVAEPGSRKYSSEVEVETFDGTRHRAQVVRVQPKLALAVVKINSENNSLLNLASQPPRNGERVLVIGSTGREFLTRVSGRITEVGDVLGLYSRDRNFVPGFGGGPVIDIQGTVLGLNWGALDPPRPGVAQFVRADKIRNYLTEIGVLASK
jgi:S1-C subfamily serine protease